MIRNTKPLALFHHESPMLSSIRTVAGNGVFCKCGILTLTPIFFSHFGSSAHMVPGSPVTMGMISAHFTEHSFYTSHFKQLTTLSSLVYRIFMKNHAFFFFIYHQNIWLSVQFFIIRVLIRSLNNVEPDLYLYR